ncbi:hypothetical protein ACYSNW_01445 [Enterococcus sp. LJL99]
MQLTIPDEVIHTELVNQLVSTVISEVEKRLKLVNKSMELGPYPNKSEIRSILGIGNDKLNDWEAKGLKFQHWSKQDIRVDREELQRFLKNTFEI